MRSALRLHWKVYLMEAICLGLFMISASAFGTLLEYPSSPVHMLLPVQFVRDCIMGAAMGLTAMLIIYSPMGRISGAHMNPAVTLTFLRLQKIEKWDAFYYIVFQCMGGIASVYLMYAIIGAAFKDPHVNFVVTQPGAYGNTAALVAELAIAFVMMVVVLVMSNAPRTAPYTGIAAGLLVMAYVIVTGRISGFGMNPARSLASAVPSGMYTAFWIYLVAPVAGMMAGAALFRFANKQVLCAKLHHDHHYTCIFRCGYCKHTH